MINTGYLRWKTQQVERAPDMGSAAVQNETDTVNSTSYGDLAGFTVDIEGDGTTRVILVSVVVEPDASSRTLYLKCIRTTNGADTDIADEFTLSVPGSTGTFTTVSPAWVDTPAIGAHTYRIQAKASSSAVIDVTGNMAVR